MTQRKAQVKSMRGITLRMEQVRAFVGKILTDKNKTDIAFTWLQDYLDFSVYNKEEMTDQMKLWKNLAKEGKLQMYEVNNKEHDVNGKTIYTFVITPIGANAFMCPLALSLGVMVDGYTYAFTKKENRDAIYTYIKKSCVEESPETDSEEESE